MSNETALAVAKEFLTYLKQQAPRKTTERPWRLSSWAEDLCYTIYLRDQLHTAEGRELGRDIPRSVQLHVARHLDFATRWIGREANREEYEDGQISPQAYTTWHRSWDIQDLQRPVGIWFIGLPGSGKSTLAASLYLYLLNQRFGEAAHVPLALIDGDLTRKKRITRGAGQGVMFTLGGNKRGKVLTSRSRIAGASSFAWFIADLLGTNGIVIGSTFCPLYIQRIALQQACHGRLLLVHMNTPFEVCKARRVREGYYTRLKKDPGIRIFQPPDRDSPVPAALHIDTSRESLCRSIERIVGALVLRGWLELPKEPSEAKDVHAFLLSRLALKE